MTDSQPRGIGVSMDFKPHAYDLLANPELFKGVLARRLIAFAIDIVIIMLPVVINNPLRAQALRMARPAV